VGSVTSSGLEKRLLLQNLFVSHYLYNVIIRDKFLERNYWIFQTILFSKLAHNLFQKRSPEHLIYVFPVLKTDQKVDLKEEKIQIPKENVLKTIFSC